METIQNSEPLAESTGPGDASRSGDASRGDYASRVGDASRDGDVSGEAYPGRSKRLHHRVRFRNVADLAAGQHGAVGRQQLLAAGCPEHWIRDQVALGTLHVVHDGVYAVGHPRLSRRGQAAAALLRAGSGSVISHLSAARAWELVDGATDGPIHVSLARRRGMAHTADITVHRPRSLPESDKTRHRGIALTTPERTILDLTPTSTVVELSRMLERMVTVLGREPDAVHAWGAAARPVRARPQLLRALDDLAAPVVLRSELESQFRSLCQGAGLPLPETNVRVGAWELDTLWRTHSVVVELDSWRWHGGKWAFHRDRRKALALSKLGLEVLRVTWPQVKYEPDEVAAALRAALVRNAGRAWGTI